MPAETVTATTFHGLRHLTGNSQPEQKITTPGPWDDSKVWCTLGQGITNEVYYPRADTPNVRDGQYLVSDGSVSPTKSVTFLLRGPAGAEVSTGMGTRVPRPVGLWPRSVSAWPLVSVGRALEGRLARAACRVHVPAPVARLRRVGGADENNPAARVAGGACGGPLYTSSCRGSRG